MNRHRPGTIYACDARHFGADRRLCPTHSAAEKMQDLLERLDRQDAHAGSPEQASAGLRLLAVEARAILTEIRGARIGGAAAQEG